MPTAFIERHLAAIVAADVVGYSRLMGVDEKGTLLALMRHRTELIDPLTAAYKGRLVKTTGDGLLLLFPSVVEAVSCALAMQRGVAERNRDILAERRIEFRVGINIGDVIVEKGDVFGDGVNIAARLEQIAPPGGICLSEDAYRQVRGKLDIPIADAGEQHLKNIASPVRAFRIEPSALVAFDAPPPPDVELSKRGWPTRAIAGAAVTAAVLLAAGGWFALTRDRTPVVQSTATSKPAAVSPMPVIAVLPFANQTGDGSQEYFADGVTEEVINALGRFNTIRVIGRNAVLRYKKQPPTQDEITSGLGASYLVSGSVRRSGQQVRITAQLAQARDGTVMWSDRYDGEMTDIFDFQDTIARRIAGTLAANITHVEARRQLDQPPRPNASAFDLVLRARAIGYSGSRMANRQFRELVARAIEMDPNYAAAWALQSDAFRSLAILGWTEFPDRDLSRAAADAQKAIALAPNEPDGYRALGRVLMVRAEYEQSKDALKRAVEINPSDANALAAWGSAQTFAGEISGAIESLQLALKLDPTLEPTYLFDLEMAYYLAGRYDDVLRIADLGLARYPDFPVFNTLAAAAAAQSGRKDEAAQYAEAVRQKLPTLDLESMGSRFKNPAHAASLREGLKLAGF